MLSQLNLQLYFIDLLLNLSKKMHDTNRFANPRERYFKQNYS